MKPFNELPNLIICCNNKFNIIKNVKDTLSFVTKFLKNKKKVAKNV